MNYLTLVLGDDFFLYFILAVVIGVVSGFSRAAKISKGSIDRTDEAQFLLAKAAAIGVLCVLSYLDSRNISQAIVGVTVPIGLYKVVQIFSALFFVWRQPEPATETAIQADFING